MTKIRTYKRFPTHKKQLPAAHHTSWDQFLRGYQIKQAFACFAGKLWLNDAEMTWRQDMQLPSSEESKIALQARLGLSPSKLISRFCADKILCWRSLTGKWGQICTCNIPHVNVKCNVVQLKQVLSKNIINNIMILPFSLALVRHLSYIRIIIWPKILF